MLGLTHGKVQLSVYDSAWPRVFAEEKERLQVSLAGSVLDIQHIGSTSVPGMPAKPILDIGIAVKNFELVAECVPTIEQLGYTHKGENGIPRRHYFVKGAPRTHHVHMFELENDEWTNHLLFRDYLIENPDAALEYARLKQELARRFETNREAYQAGKSDFINAVLQKARERKRNVA